jgi:hypothetical protein
MRLLLFSSSASLSAPISGSSSMAAVLSVAVALAAPMAGSSSMGATLSGGGSLTAAIASSSSMTATLSQAASLAAPMSGSSALSATFRQAIAIAAPMAGSSSMAAAFGGSGSFSAPMAGSSSMAATIVATVSTPYFERDLVAYLNGLGLPVYPGHIPQSASLPAMSFFLANADRLNRMSGPAGLAEVRVQIGVSSRSYAHCGSYSEALRVGLQGYIQAYMGQTFIHVCLCGNEVTQYAGAVDGTDKGVHTKIREFIFHYRESIPSLA